LLPTSVEAPFDATAEKALAGASAVANRFGQVDVTTAHLFLAVLEGKATITDTCLRSTGIDPTATAEAITAFIRDGP